MVKEGQQKKEEKNDSADQEQKAESTEPKQVGESSSAQQKEVQEADKQQVEKSQKESSEHPSDEQKQQSQENPDDQNPKGVELKSQKQASQESDQKDGENRQKQNSQMQQKFEQNLNTAISAMGGFMSGIINKVQQGAQSSLGGNAQQNQSSQIRRHRSEDVVQEREVLMQSAQNRKSSVYSQLKDWDTQRINALNIHRNIIESILGRVDQRMKASQDNLTGVAIFIKVIVDQIKASVTVNLPNISNTHIYKSVYNKIFDSVTSFEHNIQKQKEKALSFFDKVEVDIHQGLILPEAENYSNTIATIRQNLLNLKRSLHEQQLKVSRKSLKVKDVYTHNIDLSKRAKKDFQKSLYSFLLACQDFRDLQIVLAKATVGFWKKAVELEKHRSKAIHKIITAFNQLHDEFVVKQGLPTHYTEEMATTLQSQVVTDEFIASHMDFNAIISPEDQIYISTQLKKPKKITIPAQNSADGKQEVPEQGIYDITIQEVYHFLTKIIYPQFDDTGLAHKKMCAQREFPKDHFKNTTIVITPDAFLLCYDDIVPANLQKDEEEHKDQQSQQPQQQDENKRGRSSSHQAVEDDQYQRLFYQRKPDYQMQIQQVSLKKVGLALDLKSQSKSTFMQLLRPSNDIKFVFKSSDQMEEFIQIIHALEEVSD